MIRINLLSDRDKGREGGRRNVLRAAAVLAAVTLSVGVGLTVVGIVRSLNEPPTQEPVVAEEDYRPSTYAKSDIVEDVVDDEQQDELILEESGLLKLPYSELSFEEKVNYEWLFATQVFELLGKAVPPEVGLQSLVLDSFKTIRAVGLGESRRIVSRIFKKLEQGRVSILPRPRTRITSADEGEYRFAITMEAEFGLNTKAAEVDLGLSAVPTRSGLDYQVHRFTETAEETDIQLTADLKVVERTKLSRYRRFVYRMKGVAAYEDIVAFASALNRRSIPCAFEYLRLIAQAPGMVKIEAEILFTTRH
jgi:hypothetical protein